MEWSEKTVEYAFLAEGLAKKKFQHIIPLDGGLESAIGDAVLRWDGALYLLEFKRDYSARRTEAKKYALDPQNPGTEYETAMAELAQLPGRKAHCLAYGRVHKSHANVLNVKGFNYEEWPDIAPRPHHISVWSWIDSAAAAGVTQEDFDAYIAKLSSFRFAKLRGTSDEVDSDDSGEGSAGQIGPALMVVAVGKGGAHYAEPLADYVHKRPALKKEIEENLKNAQAPSAPAPSAPARSTLARSTLAPGSKRISRVKEEDSE